MTSQFFANIYLNGLDHYIKESMACHYYLRYMDDFVIFHQDKRFLLSIKERVQEYLENLKLKLHEGKCRVYRVADGVSFLGLVISSERRRLKRRNVIRFKRKMKYLQRLFSKNKFFGIMSGNPFNHGSGMLPMRIQCV